MISTEKQLQHYLECESLLNQFFKQVNYCETHCINQPISKFSKHARGDLGCCLGEFYKFPGKLTHKELALLNKKRIEKYGLPKNKEERIMALEKPCSYHTKKGCILKDHKGLACISYVCKDYIDHLKQKFNIDYNHDEIRNFLEDIFIGNVDDEKLKIFKLKIKNWIERTIPQ